MALFTSKADKDINLLTAFYQVEIPAELTKFFELRGYDPLKQFENDPDARDNRIFVIHRYQTAVKTLMDALADGGTVAPGLVAILRDLVDKYANAHKSRMVSITGRGGVRGLVHIDDFENLTAPVPAKNLSVLHGDYIDIVEEMLGYEIINLLNVKFPWREEREVIRCAECSNPAVAINEQQVYCSFRCKNRVAARRAYVKRFGEYKQVRGGKTR